MLLKNINLEKIKFFAVKDGMFIPFKTTSLSINHSWESPMPSIELEGYIVGRTPLEPIKRVIFNGPATIVIWNDGTKTIVKCQEGDTFSKELGLAMAISKKFLGNKSNFNNVFNKWIKEENT